MLILVVESCSITCGPHYLHHGPSVNDGLHHTALSPTHAHWAGPRMPAGSARALPAYTVPWAPLVARGPYQLAAGFLSQIFSSSGLRLDCYGLRTVPAYCWSSLAHIFSIWTSFGLFLGSLDFVRHLSSHFEFIMDRILRYFSQQSLPQLDIRPPLVSKSL